MGDTLNYLGELFALSGLLWTIAVVGAFIAGAGEKSYPNEGAKHSAPLALIAGIVSLITPFLLFLHAFWAITPQASVASVNVLGVLISNIGAARALLLFAVMAVLVIAPALMGTLIAVFAPPVGKLLYLIAPYLHLLVFALTVFATHANVLALANAVLSRPSAL